MEPKCPLCEGVKRETAPDCYACNNPDCELYAATLSLEAWNGLVALKKEGHRHEILADADRGRWRLLRQEAQRLGPCEHRDNIVELIDKHRPPN